MATNLDKEHVVHEAAADEKTKVQNLVRSAKASLELQQKALKEASDIVEGM